MTRKVAPKTTEPKSGSIVASPDASPVLSNTDTRSEAERLLDRLQRERPDKVIALNLRVETLEAIREEHPRLMKAMFDFAKGKFPKNVPAQALKAQADVLRSLLDVLTVKVRENEQSGGADADARGPTSPVTIIMKGVEAPKPVNSATIEVED